MKVYTVVVHSLQMCMKEYRCCLKLRRGDNSTYTFTKSGVVFKFWTVTISLHAHLQVVYYKCVKFHKNPISGLGGVALTRHGRTDRRTDGVIPIYPPNFVCGGYGYKNY
jgi:hypothetical protein